MIKVIFHLIIFGKAPEVALLHLDEIGDGCHADVDHYFDMYFGRSKNSIYNNMRCCAASNSTATKRYDRSLYL